MPTKVSKKVVGMIIRSRKTIMKDGVMTVSYIFLPFVWGVQRVKKCND
jgi:hypothetical protein